MTNKILKSFIAFLLLSVSSLTAQNPYLVNEISIVTKPSTPQCFSINNGELYFSTDDGIHGNELWKTDGTTEGTIMVKDINSSGGGIGTSAGKFVSINNILYFTGSSTPNENDGYDLWRTDGTALGTYLVKDLNSSWSNLPKCFTNYNNTLFFTLGGDLWKSDGTDAGTVIVKTSCAYGDLIVYGGKLMFSGNYALWESNGSTAGTMLVKNFGVQGNAGPQKYIVYNNNLYFEVKDTLWVSDGTTLGTNVVVDSSGVTLTRPRSLAVSNNILYVGTRDPGIDGLWRTDGTPSGTYRIKQFSSIYSGDPLDLTDVNGTLYFVAHDSNVGILEPLNKTLWKSDGTTNGTEFIKVINPSGNWSMENAFFNFQNTLYMNAYDTINGYELWSSDGTTSGTSIIKNIAPNSWSSAPTEFIEMNSKLFFSVDDNAHGRELWSSDGTPGGTKLLLDINNARESNIEQLTKVNNRLFFSAKSVNEGDELWISDGTNSGTNMVADIARPNAIGPQKIIELNGLAYYNTPNYYNTSGSVGYGIYKSNGVASGTELVKDWYVQGMKKVGNKLYGSYPGFWLSDGTTVGTQQIAGFSAEYAVFFNNNYFIQDWSTIYKSDGTTPGTQFFKSFQSLSDLIVSNDTLYFVGEENNVQGIWKSDGTLTGTQMIKQVYADGLTDINSIIYFRGNPGSGSGSELWKSDGTEAGTIMVKDINVAGNSSPINLINANGTLFFVANNGINGGELWKSDGTDTGTVMVKDIYQGAASAFSYSTDSVPYFTYADGLLYFTANDGINGFELWRTDGTEAGTFMVKDLYSNGSSYPKEMTLISGTLYFTAYDSLHGRGLWANEIYSITNCFALYTTSYDTLQNTFFLTVDPSTTAQATSYYWDFGDGSTSSLSAPSYTYANDGIYNVCLKARTALGDSCVYCHEIGKDSLGNITRSGGFDVVVQNGAVGLNFIRQEQPELLVYPNPTTSEAKILLPFEMKNALARIVNVLGKKTKELHSISGNEFTIDLIDQSPGIYFIEVEERGKKWRTKIVKN